MPKRAANNDFQPFNITQMDSPSSQLSNKPSYVAVGQHLGKKYFFHTKQTVTSRAAPQEVVESGRPNRGGLPGRAFLAISI